MIYLNYQIYSFIFILVFAYIHQNNILEMIKRKKSNQINEIFVNKEKEKDWVG